MKRPLRSYCDEPFVYHSMDVKRRFEKVEGKVAVGWADDRITFIEK